MAGRTTNDQKPNPEAIERKEMAILSQKPGLDFMQNCDLPPPLKVFSRTGKTVWSSMNRICSTMMSQEDIDELHIYRTSSENEKLELLKALRLSQTRAREAERKAAVLVKERDTLSNALLEESSRLFAHRQWVKLLELQVSKLQRQQQQEPMCGAYGRTNVAKVLSNREDDNEGGGSMTWFVALALSLGIAGVGFAFGFRYMFLRTATYR